MIVNEPLSDPAEQEIITIVLPGGPVAWARSRHRGGQHFTPVRQRNEVAALKIAALGAMRGRQLILGPVELDVLAEFATPKSWSQKRRAAEIDNPSFPTKRPDYDNIAKLAADALNGVVYLDDAQIVTAHIRKRYASAPRLVIIVAPILGGSETDDLLKNPRLLSQPGSDGKTTSTEIHTAKRVRHAAIASPQSV